MKKLNSFRLLGNSYYKCHDVDKAMTELESRNNALTQSLKSMEKKWRDRGIAIVELKRKHRNADG